MARPVETPPSAAFFGHVLLQSAPMVVLDGGFETADWGWNCQFVKLIEQLAEPLVIVAGRFQPCRARGGTRDHGAGCDPPQVADRCQKLKSVAESFGIMLQRRKSPPSGASPEDGAFGAIIGTIAKRHPFVRRVVDIIRRFADTLRGQRRDLPEILGIRFQRFKKAAEGLAAIRERRFAADLLGPTAHEAMERMFSVFERDTRRFAQPSDQ